MSTEYCYTRNMYVTAPTTLDTRFNASLQKTHSV